MRVTRPDVFKDHHVVWRWLPLDRRCGSGAVAPKIRSFASADAFFAAGRIADVLIIATQNSHHFEHAMSALYLGYDILLEKPAAESLERCEEIDRRARQLGQRVVPCFVLRYTPFYSTVKRLIDSGKLGRVISIRTHEGVEPFHQAHSFVRGHWSKTTDSTPMIVAKCSHDVDLLCWLGGAPAVAISSHGNRSWFRAENAPNGAPPRCTDDCPAAQDCIYDAHRYLKQKRRWLGMVKDGWKEVDDTQVLDFLKTSPWGRGVYQCDNDAVDHQVIACELANGITATHIMTAFDSGRGIEIYGTQAALKGGAPYKEVAAPELWLRDHATGAIETVEVAHPGKDGYAGHGGGDGGLMEALASLFRSEHALAPGLDGLADHRENWLLQRRSGYRSRFRRMPRQSRAK